MKKMRNRHSHCLLLIAAPFTWSFIAASTAPAQSAADPYARPAPKYKFEIRKNVMVSMRDGVRLTTDIYTPTGRDE